MRKSIYQLTILIFLINLLNSCVKDREFINDQNNIIDLGTRKLIHYWNFNDTSSNANLIKPSFSVDPSNAKIDFDFLSVSGVDGYYDFLNPSTTNLNLRNGDVPGSLLRVRNPSSDMIISIPTRHYKNVVLQYAVAISSVTSGALNDSVYYTIDGVNYTNQGLSNPNYTPSVDPDFKLVSYDLTAIAGANDNPNLKFKIIFNNGNTNTKGNTRFDNITVDADTLIGSTSIDHFPVAIDDQLTTSMDSTISGSIANNDIPSADGGNHWSVITNPINGTITLDSLGNYNYTPNSHFIGSDSFSYKIVDADGDADTAMVYVSINALPLILMDYWDFNNVNGGLSSMIIPTVTNDPVNTKLEFVFGTSGTTTGYYDTIASTTSLNIANGSSLGYSLRVRNPSNEITISAPTTNFKNIILKYATAISSAKYAPRTQSYSYSIDNGASWTTSGLARTVDTFAIDANDSTRFVDPNYVLKTFDLSNISSINNNAGFKFKITFGASNTPTSPTKGNTRYDNITIEGNRQ